MKYSIRAAEDLVRGLIASANRTHIGEAWDYELTSDVDNIDVV